MRGPSPVAVASPGARTLAGPLVFRVALTAALTGLALWRAACVLAGPDADSDAYAHHMIARAILADPHDLAVHWVWLPLFHYLQVPLVALGGTMNDVRWANVALAAAAPLLLFAYVRRTARPAGGAVASPMSPEATAFVAAVIAGACPIAMQMGTTAQPEPLFALVTLAVAITFQRRQYLLAAPLLGAAVILRYEAWAMFATVGALLVVEAAWQARHALPSGPARPAREEGPVWRRLLVVAVPVALVLGWAALRRPVDGTWFGFLGQTHEFASQVVESRGGASGAVQLARDLLYYPIFVAARVLGPALALVPFGVVRTWRQQGGRFVLVLAAGLGFVSLTWANHSSLGLDRHFVEAVPLYATFAAQGVATVAERVGAWLSRIASADSAKRGAWAVAALLSAATLGGLFMFLDSWMGFWRATIEHGWPERTALGGYLRSLPDGTTVFCDDATLEILSGLDRHRFDRHWTDDPHTWDLIGRVADERGVAYVATWRRKLSGHEDAGAIVFRATDAPADPTAGVAVMRVLPDANRAAR